MAGMGPPPKPDDQRRRRNATVATTRLPAEGRQGSAPEWPLIPDVVLTTRHQLAEAKVSSLEFDLDEAMPSARGAIERKLDAAKERAAIMGAQLREQRHLEATLWADMWRLPQAVQWERLGWTRDVAQYVRHKVMAELGDMDGAREARQWSDRLGLSPMAMLRLRWEVVADEVTARRETKAAPPKSARARLKVVDPGAVAGPEHAGEFPTLGWSVGEWIEANCVIPDGDHIGDPYLLTDEMWTFLAWHYRLRPDATEDAWQAAWTFRRSQLVRPQKWGKGPFLAAIFCAEAVGDVRFAGWDADGEPVGRPWGTPWIQVTATSEDQTANVYRALVPMINEGPLADWIPDTGETRINIPGGGLIEPVTASGRARLGQRITCAGQDETHCWVETNGGWRLAETQRRNLSGTGGRAVETTNAWDPSEQSVAQRTSEARVRDVYRDHPMPPRPSLGNKAERRKALRMVYGDSMTVRAGSAVKPWVNLERIDAEAVEIAEKDPGQAIRYYWNIPDAGVGSWMDGEKWDALARPRLVPAGTAVVGALDGSDVDDWTVIRLETEDGYQFTPAYGPDRRPAIWNPAEHGGQVPRLEALAAIDEIMTTFQVARFYIDPPYWETEADEAAAKYGDKRVLRWETYRAVQMHAAAERLLTDVTKADSGLHHDGCQVTALHMRNARRAARPGQRYVLKKASPSQKIDACVTSIICHEAAGDVTAAKLWPKVVRRQVIAMR